MFHHNAFDPRSFSTYSWKTDGEPEPTKRSGAFRLWLIDYYTQEWAKKKAEDKPVETAQAEVAELAVKKRKPRKPKVPREVIAMVSKAEQDLDRLMQGAADASAAQLFVFQLLNFALDKPVPETIDFLQIAKEYREKQRRDDDEMLLLSMVI